MATFNAENRVHKWNFERFGGDKGEFHEPPVEVLDEFMSASAALLGEALGDDDIDLTDVVQLNRAQVRMAMDRDAKKRFNERQYELITEVCGGSPSVEQMRVLPGPELMRFVAWLQELLNPEFERPGGPQPS